MMRTRVVGSGPRLGWLAASVSMVLVVMVSLVQPQAAQAQDQPPTTPTVLSTDGLGCLAPAGSRVFGSSPVLTGVPRDVAAAVRADVELRTVDGSESLRSWRSETVTTGEPVSWQVDAPLPDGRYRWRMRSVSTDGAAVGGWTGWCEFTVDATLDAEPEPEPPVELECPVAAGEPLEANDESIALALAKACGAPAEVLSERSFQTRVLAQPDGTLLDEQYTVPQWVRDSDGEWVEVDPSFEVRADGSIATSAVVSEIEVSTGGAGDPLLTATDPEGGSVSLSWPEPLPAPAIDGDTVTYPDVMPDVDLQLTAGLDGFSYVLVVKTPAAAASPELASISVGVDTGGGLTMVQDADGTVAAQDAQGEVVFSAPAAYAWDSSEPEEPPATLSEEEGSGDPDEPMPGRFTEMPLELDGETLTVEPDPALLSDPEAEFPIMIDPPFSGKRMHWASVHRDQPGRGWTNDSAWPRAGGMRVGNLQWWPGYPCGDACGVWRSAIRFNIKRLSGKQIISAKVKAVQTHTSGCGSYGLQLWYVTAFRSGTSWNGLSDNWRDHLQTQSPPSSNRTGGCSGTEAAGITYGNSAVRGRVQSHADAGHNSLSFGFRSSDEAAKQAYRRIAVKSVKLEVKYNRPAQPPTNLKTDGKACDFSAPGPWITTQHPTLSAKPRDPDGRVGIHLQVRKVGSSSNYYSRNTSPNKTHNEVFNDRVDRRLPSGKYRWRARSLDSHDGGTDSDWRQWCYFRVDATSPTTPKVELMGDPPTAGEPVTVRFTSSDKHSGLAGFRYGVNEEVKRHSVASSGTATITFTALPEGGRNLVYVWSRDTAGNYSNQAVFDVFAARLVAATPAAAWRLDGDGLDDSGHGHELTLGSGVTWEGDAAPPADSSLGFDGTGCVATDGPVVRTDAEYTVTAWVRLDSTTGPYVIMAPAGQARPGFSLRYGGTEDRWIFVLGSQDSIEEPVWVTLQSADPPVTGQWTHLAVRVDPAARHMQMFINGQLSGERDIPFIPWNADGPMQVGCSGPVTGDTWGHFQGAIHHVGVWQGLLTPAQLQAAYGGELPAGLTGHWRLRGDGEDTSAFARDIQPPSPALWVDDQYGRRRSALRLDGTGWAEGTGPVVRTDQSFSVAGWVKLDNKEDFRTIASQGGVFVTGFNLNYHPAVDRWQFSMSSHDDADLTTVAWHRARSSTSPVLGDWYHLLGVYDQGANQLRLYVNGELQGTSEGPATPWQAGGPLLVGTGGNTSGERSNRMVGTISDVQTWRGALTDAQASEVYGGNPAVRHLARWNLDANGNDFLGNNHPLTLVGAEGVDYEWVDDRACLPWSALGLRVAGEAYAHTAGPVLVTDESYTVTAWVKLDAVIDEHQTVLAQAAGDGRAAFLLQATPGGAWRMSMPQAENGESEWVGAETPAGTVEPGKWTHVAGVFNVATGEAHVYVNGEPVATGDGPDAPWHADGPFYIGTGKPPGSTMYEPVHGAIDGVSAYSSTLDPDEIARLGEPLFGGGLCG